MSRIGKMPISLAGGVTVTQTPDRKVTVKGPKGELAMQLRPEVDLEIGDKEASVELNGRGDVAKARAFHGLSRALINNMVEGVTKGYEKTLEIVGVGWNAQGAKTKLTLNIGFCHPVVVDMPKGVEVETANPTTIVVRGADKQAVGQIAAVIRKVRPPEPYKGKGIRYQGEYVRRKAGKSFGS